MIAPISRLLEPAGISTVTNSVCIFIHRLDSWIYNKDPCSHDHNQQRLTTVRNSFSDFILFLLFVGASYERRDKLSSTGSDLWFFLAGVAPFLPQQSRLYRLHWFFFEPTQILTFGGSVAASSSFSEEGVSILRSGRSYSFSIFRSCSNCKPLQSLRICSLKATTSHCLVIYQSNNWPPSS